MQTITKHYIDGAFVEPHGHELMDIISPHDRKDVLDAWIRRFYHLTI